MIVYVGAGSGPFRDLVIAAMNMDDFNAWKFGLVDEAERFLDKRPVPPVFH